jgi:hypothetical protein
MTYKYRISGDDVVIIGESDVPEHGISLQDFTLYIYLQLPIVFMPLHLMFLILQSETKTFFL